MHKIYPYIYILVLLFSGSLIAQDISIPDPIFKIRLLTHDPVIDTNEDGEIQQNEALEVTTSLYLSGDTASEQNILDLTGIEAFINLKTINASNNELTSIDVSQHLALENLRVNNNNISQIDVSQNAALKLLSMYNNSLSSLDVTNNPNLRSLLVSNMNLESLDTSQNILLRDLVVENCALSNINLTQNTNLEIISLNNNPLQEINLSTTPLLEELELITTQITTLELETLSGLKKVNLSGSILQHLDVSANPALEKIDLRNSLFLQELNIKNQNNNTIDISSTFPSNFTNLPQLDRVCIDDVNSPLAIFIIQQVDHPVTFSENCSLLNVGKNQKIHLVIYPNPTQSIINIESVEDIVSIKLISIHGQIIKPEIIGSTQLDFSSLPQGVYIVEIKFDNDTVLRKKISKH